MLIIPIAGRFDWRHPPLVTLLLILLNTVVFLATADKDERAYSKAYRYYLSENLLEYEKPIFRAYADNADWLARWELSQVPTEDEDIVQYIMFDRKFDSIVAEQIEIGESLESGESLNGADISRWSDGRARFLSALRESPAVGHGLIPAESRPLSYLTSMFLHGGVDHLLGNMVFLFIFGFALERVLGALNYLSAYLVTGLAGGLLHALVLADSYIPTIGASGAVSGLMGAYLAVYRLRHIRFFYTVVFYFGSFRAPALAVLPVWLGVELYGYYFGDGGIAYWDHIGGLLAGAVAGSLAWQLGRLQDEAYLEETTENDERAAVVAQLEQQIDTANFDRARVTASTWLRSQPEDEDLWLKYADLMEGREQDPTYDAFAQGLFALTNHPVRLPATRDVIHDVYKVYVSRPGPKPALKQLTTITALGRRFLADGHISSAQQIARAILKSDTKNVEAGRLVKLLSDHFATEGSIDVAQKYSTAYRQRFRQT